MIERTNLLPALQRLKEHAGIIFLCLLFFSLGIARLNEVSFLTPDSGLYMIWGNSLAQGKGFVDETQPEPDRFVNHGPLYPLLIAPVALFFPYSIVAAKIWTLLLGAVFLALLYRWLSLLHDARLAIAATVLVASNPALLVYATEVLSDIPFLAAFALSLLLIERIFRGEEGTWSFHILLAAIISAVLLREVGIALVAAAGTFFLLRRRPKQALTLVLVSAAVLGLWYLRNHYFSGPSRFSQTGNLPWFFEPVAAGADSSLMSELAARFIMNLKAYHAYLTGLVFYPAYISPQLAGLLGEVSPLYRAVAGVFNMLWYSILATGAVALVVGMIVDFRKSQTALFRGLFLLFYLGIVFLFPFNDVRYMLPLLPFFALYALHAIHAMIESKAAWGKVVGGRYGIVILLALLIPNATAVAAIVSRNIIREYSSYKPWQQLRRWMLVHTSPAAAFAGPVKDLAVIGEGRVVMDLHPSVDLPEFEKALRENAIGYLFSVKEGNGPAMYEHLMLSSHRFRFDPVCELPPYTVFAVQPMREFHGSTRYASIDTSTAAGLISRGTLSIQSEEYDAAVTMLSRARAAAPDQPDAVYHLLTAFTLMGDSANARACYRDLLAFPSGVGIYVNPARRRLEALAALIDARDAADPHARSIRTTNSAGLFWNLGYPRKSAAIMAALLSEDTTYFVGLLWGFHYNLQTGHTDNAVRYQSILKRIDAKNPIVLAFDTILACRDSLARTGDAAARSRLHLRMAQQYRAIELPDETIDEAELALGEDPANSTAARLAGDFYAGRQRFRAAQHYYNLVPAADSHRRTALGRSDSLSRHSVQ